MNFGQIIKAGCVDTPATTNPSCADAGFALLNPDICGGGSSSQLVIKPANALCCLLGSIQYQVVLIKNGQETDVTAQASFQTSNPGVAVVGASSGNATGVGGGDVLITAIYNGLTSQAALMVFGETNCCDQIEVGLMVLVDTSRSMSQPFNSFYQTKLSYAIAAAKQFIGQINGTKDKVGLMSFNDGADIVLSDLTHDETTVEGLAGSIVQTQQMTGYAKGLTDAISALNASGASQLALVLITDGFDTSATAADQSSSVQLLQQFKSAGGIVLCLGVRANGSGFSFLEALSTGGFFVNGYDATATAAIDYLCGFKGYICAGNCTPAGDSYVAKGQFDYCGFHNWNVVGGHVDLLGNGFLDYLPSNGLYVELAGSTSPHQGTMVSKNSFLLTKGDVYRLSLSLAGNQRVAGSPNTVQMRVFGRNNDGLANPSVAPGLAVIEAGNPLSQTPTYKYVYTYTNANGETAPSPVASATPTEDGASITVQAASNAAATAINIYRTTGETPDSPYYLIATISNTAPLYTDYMNEADMLAAIVAGTVDACNAVPVANTTGSTVDYLNQSVSVNNYQQGFVPQSFTFTAPDNMSVWISIQQTAVPAGAAAIGLLMDAVSFDDVTTLVNLLSDSFDTENETYIPPACGQGGQYVQQGTIATLIPPMTSNATPSGTVSASSSVTTYPGYFDPWRAFNGFANLAQTDPGRNRNQWQSSVYPSSTPQWLQYQFAFPQSVTAYELSLIHYVSTDPNSGEMGPTSWQFQGSNDGSSWTTLDTHTNYMSGNIHVTDPATRFQIGSPQSFIYYRLYVTATQVGGNVGVTEFQMFSGASSLGYVSGYNCYGSGCISTPPPAQASDPNPLVDNESGYTPSVTYTSTQQACVGCANGQVNFPTAGIIPDMTSNTTPSGVVSASSSANPGFEYRQFGGQAPLLTTQPLPQWLQYQFPSPQTPTSYSFSASFTLVDANGHPMPFPKKWSLEASNDGSTWVTLDTQTKTTGWLQYEIERYPIANPAAYLYFRITVSEAQNPPGQGGLPPNQFLITTEISNFNLFIDAPQSVCASASATSEISQADADSKALASATASATAQLNCVQGYTATENYTANCPSGTNGSSTKSATAVSFDSLAVAQANALAAAIVAAEAALVCVCADTSANPITINANTAATPYASTKCVSGLTGNITKVTATITGLSHTSVADVAIVLMSPSGKLVCLMSGCGAQCTVAGLNLVFDDAAGSSLPATAPDCSNPLTSGTFKPTKVGGFPSMPQPCPSTAQNATLAALNGDSPNGSWQLFVASFGPFDTGAIASFTLNITSA